MRATLDASQYKHTVLGLIFLKYVSDSFDIRRNELISQFKNPDHEYFLDPADFGDADSADYQAEINAELEQRDYYAETNVFWVPRVARWEFLQNQNKVVINSVIWLSKTGEVLTQAPEDETEKRLCTRISSVGQLIDHALKAIEHDNAKLKGILNKRYTSLQIDPAKLGELIDLIATIPFKHSSLSSKDILGHVYEYFLGQFALAEGKKGGQFYTPKAIVSLIVQMLEPFKGRVYDPAMGSGGFFVQSESFTVLLLIIFCWDAVADTAYKVVGIADGDTVTLLSPDKRQLSIRMMAIDAPEKAQPYGNVAKKYLSGLIFQKEVEIDPYKVDRYGRTVATLWLGEQDINLTMVKAGMAWVYTKYADPQDIP